MFGDGTLGGAFDALSDPDYFVHRGRYTEKGEVPTVSDDCPNTPPSNEVILPLIAATAEKLADSGYILPIPLGRLLFYVSKNLLESSEAYKILSYRQFGPAAVELQALTGDDWKGVFDKLSVTDTGEIGDRWEEEEEVEVFRRIPAPGFAPKDYVLFLRVFDREAGKVCYSRNIPGDQVPDFFQDGSLDIAFPEPILVKEVTVKDWDVSVPGGFTGDSWSVRLSLLRIPDGKICCIVDEDMYHDADYFWEQDCPVCFGDGGGDEIFEGNRLEWLSGKNRKPCFEFDETEPPFSKADTGSSPDVKLSTDGHGLLLLLRKAYHIEKKHQWEKDCQIDAIAFGMEMDCTIVAVGEKEVVEEEELCVLGEAEICRYNQQKFWLGYKTLNFKPFLWNKHDRTYFPYREAKGITVGHFLPTLCNWK